MRVEFGLGPTDTVVVIDLLLPVGWWWFVIVGPVVVVGRLALEVVGCRVGWSVVGGAPVRPEPSSSVLRSGGLRVVLIEGALTDWPRGATCCARACAAHSRGWVWRVLAGVCVCVSDLVSRRLILEHSLGRSESESEGKHREASGASHVGAVLGIQLIIFRESPLVAPGAARGSHPTGVAVGGSRSR